MSCRKTVVTEKAPPAIGPYSQAVRAGGLVYASGQIPLNPDGQDLVPGGIEAQTKQVFENLRALLEAAGSGFDRVLKVTVYMTNLEDFGAMNGVYAGYFPRNPPARSTVEVSRLPKGAGVEIDLVALDGR